MQTNRRQNRIPATYSSITPSGVTCLNSSAVHLLGFGFRLTILYSLNQSNRKAAKRYQPF